MMRDRRQFTAELGGIFATLSALRLAPAQAAEPRTVLSILGNKFLINGQPTYPGRTYLGHTVEGLLFVSRMVNAVVDDQNPETRGVWAYSDGPWDPERNTNEFIRNLPLYRACGLTAVAFNLQGGSPQGYSWNQPWHLSGFNPDGALRPEYKARVARVIEAADAIGLAIILGCYYPAATPRLRDEAAVIRGVDEVTEFLCAGNYGNVLVEIGNEVNIRSWPYDIVKPSRSHELIERVQKNSAGRLKTPAGRLLVSTSFTHVQPPDNYLRIADYILLHGNGYKRPDELRTAVNAVRAASSYKGQPVLFNEDDHYDFDLPDNDMIAAIEKYCGWGFFDYRRSREGYIEGYQSLPVDWGIDSERKKAFFTLLAKITGAEPP